ncbi:MAG TPA: alpha/beta hydrolase [Caulobacteraceae bacterium]
MQAFTLTASDGASLAAWRSLPAGEPKAILQISHGMAEHFARYGRLARGLGAAGYAVYGGDHRGHGQSASIHGLGSFGERGFQAVVDDMAALSAVARRELPGRPLVLLGHSMGSFAAQLYILEHSHDLAALVLSGTAALDQLLAAMLSSGGPVSMEQLNAAFEPGRTRFDWLSRDEAEVDAYVADPLCGFDLDQASMQSIFGLGATARTDPRLAQVRKSLPIYVISGERDPVTGPDQAFTRALIESYEAAGLGPIDHRVYPGARHELFNETCRDQVEADLIAWLDATVGQA